MREKPHRSFECAPRVGRLGAGHRGEPLSLGAGDSAEARSRLSKPRDDDVPTHLGMIMSLIFLDCCLILTAIKDML